MSEVWGWLVAVVAAAAVGALGSLLWQRRSGAAPAAGEDPEAARRREDEARAAVDEARARAEIQEQESRRRREEAEDAARREQAEIQGETLDETLERLDYDGGPLPARPFAGRLRFGPDGGSGPDGPGGR